MKKRFMLGLLAILLLAGISQAASIYVASYYTATQEYFGDLKQVWSYGVRITLGVDYIVGDKLTVKITDGWVFRNSNLYLIGLDAGGAVYDRDTDNDAKNEWGIFDGGYNKNYVTFRADDDAPLLVKNSQWYLAAYDSGASQWSYIDIRPTAVPVPASLNGTAVKIWTESKDLVGTAFDPCATPYPTFFMVYIEYRVEPYPWDDVYPWTWWIDVTKERKLFTGSPDYDYYTYFNFYLYYQYAYWMTNFDAQTEDDIWKYTFTGSMQAISKISLYPYWYWSGTAFGSVVPAAGATSAVINVGADKNPNWGPIAPVFLVNGTDALDERTISFQLDWIPDGYWDFYGRTVQPNKLTQIWETNGTMFRSVWFATAKDVNNFSGFRIANDSALPGKIYADIYLDDGTSKTWVLLGEIPAMGKISINAYDMCKTAGLNVSSDYSGTWKGRVIFTCWTPRDKTYGLNFYWSGVATATIPLETTGWGWEK